LGSTSAGEAPNPSRAIKLTWGAIMAGMATILLGSGGIGAIQQARIIIAATVMVLMLAVCWTLFEAPRTDYREERRPTREVMAHDQNVEKRHMEEIKRRHDAGEPISQAVSDRDD